MDICIILMLLLTEVCSMYSIILNVTHLMGHSSSEPTVNNMDPEPETTIMIRIGVYFIVNKCSLI